jgi:small subunit ribosomal protein S16
MGNTNNPFFRVVVADSRSPAKGRFLETIGWYDPMKKDGEDVSLKMDRVEYWKGVGAQVSDTVGNLIKKYASMQPPKAEDAPAPVEEQSKKQQPAAEAAETEEPKEETAAAEA